MLTVFYDGQCSLCAKEIAYYRRIAPAGVFVWRDVLESEAELKHLGITTVAALKALHVQDEQGQLHHSLDAFILIWSRLNYWRLLAKLVSLPGIYPSVSWLYVKFAERRFRRLKHCQIAFEKENNQEHKT